MASRPWLLIVDDDRLLTDLLARIIRRHPVAGQLQVEIAHTPRDALRVVDERCDVHPLVVLSDYDLKADVDGIGLLGEVRERCPGTQRVLYSGHPRWHVEPRLTDAVHAYYEKPDRLDDLLTPIFAHVQNVLADVGGRAEA